MAISVKISEENHKKLSRLSGELQQRYERPVSINEAIEHLCKRKNILEHAGKWVLSDKEAARMKKELDKGWSAWN